MKTTHSVVKVYYYCFYCFYEAAFRYPDANRRKHPAYAILSLWHFFLFFICLGFVQLSLGIAFNPGTWLYVPAAIIFTLNYIFLIRKGTWHKITIEMQAKTYQIRVLIRCATYLIFFATGVAAMLLVVKMRRNGLLTT